MIKTDGIIFDMDGTLWDSVESITAAWNVVFSRNGLTYQATPADIQAQMGKPMPAIFAALLPDLSEDMLRKIEEDCCKYENEYLSVHGGILYPALEDTLRTLSAEYPLFIVSNCQGGYIEAFFNCHKLDRYFKDYECWGRTLLSKAENIKLVMERNGLENPVYVGDTDLDGKSSREAGISFIHAAYGFGTTDDCDASISSVSELIDLVSH